MILFIYETRNEAKHLLFCAKNIKHFVVCTLQSATSYRILFIRHECMSQWAMNTNNNNALRSMFLWSLCLGFLHCMRKSTIFVSAVYDVCIEAKLFGVGINRTMLSIISNNKYIHIWSCLYITFLLLLSFFV